MFAGVTFSQLKILPNKIFAQTKGMGKRKHKRKLRYSKDFPEVRMKIGNGTCKKKTNVRFDEHSFDLKGGMLFGEESSKECIYDWSLSRLKMIWFFFVQ